MADTVASSASPLWQARTLLRAARSGTLATARGGQPFAGLITPACAPDLSMLMLLSSLSEHTRHLEADPRCAVMVVGDAPEANPQTAPRLTVQGEAHVEPDPALKARWVARHRYAEFYAGFGDFRLFRLRPTGGHFIGGFASAHRFDAVDLVADPAAVTAIAAAEADVMAHMNEDHASAIDAMAGSPGWQVVAVDVDGCDLARAEDVLRIAWSAPVSDADTVRAELIHLSRAARSS